LVLGLVVVGMVLLGLVVLGLVQVPHKCTVHTVHAVNTVQLYGGNVTEHQTLLGRSPALLRYILSDNLYVQHVHKFKPSELIKNKNRCIISLEIEKRLYHLPPVTK
jgi:hypothetical protein